MMEEESDKIMFGWKTLQKLWKKKKQESMSSETQKGAKVDIQWCKYTVMKRRTESMLDLAETKGALTQGFSGANPRQNLRNEDEQEDVTAISSKKYCIGIILSLKKFRQGQRINILGSQKQC